MPITLTTDPIISLADAQSLVGASNDDQLKLAINSASAKFLQYTGRRKINYSASVAVVEDVRPEDARRIWLAASPIVTDGKEVTVESISDGAAANTYTYSGGDIEVVSTELYAYITPIGWSFPAYRAGDRYLRVTYFGGWSDVPGDVLAGAVAQLRVELERLGGMVGMSSISRQGESVQYDRDGVIAEAAQSWNPYVV